jgi:NAD(P)-dependent dehydrogenase (short-subunit alcohol dehydrogenase family)
MEVMDRVVVITGATGGLGRVVSQAFAQAGARLALVGRNPENLTELEQELPVSPERVLSYALNLFQPGAAVILREAILAKFGRVDVLLHFVGGWIGGKPLTQVTAEEVSSMLDQHVWTTLHLVQAFVPELVKNGWGRIVVVSSPGVSKPPANAAPYIIGKSGEEALILSLAEELKYSGVTANILHIRTIDVKHERDTSPTPKNASWTTPEEIAATIDYLCSDEAGAVNGARLPLYGSM